MRRFSFLIRIAFLVVGYYFLSPENCASTIKWFWELSALKWLAELSALKWIAAQSAIKWLVAQPWMPCGVDALGLLVMKLVPPLILVWAVLFVIRLFITLPIGNKLLFLIWLLIGVLIGLTQWNLPPERLKEISRYYDAFYASFVLVLFAGWLASLLYGFSRSGGAKALALVLFVVTGSVMYEWLASLSVVKLRDERWLRPEQLLDCIFGVVNKQSDFADAKNNSQANSAADATTSSLANKVAFGLFYTFHALLAFFGGYVVIGFVSKAAVNTILLRFSRCPNSIFWGVSPEAIVLAKSLRDKKKEKCVFVVADLASADGSVLDRLSDDGFLWVPSGRGTLQLVARSVEKHFFLSSSGSDNVEWASKLVDFVDGEPDVYVRIDDEADDSWLFRWADRDEIRKKLNVHIIRETSLAADLLLRDHPMLCAPGVECCYGRIKATSPGKLFTFRLLQIGFGAQGRMLLNRTICDAQAPGTKFSAIIVDKNQTTFDGYEILCPDVKSKYNLEYVNLDVQTKTFFDWLKEQIDSTNYTRIVVTTGNDDLNLSVASFIIRHYRERGDAQLGDLHKKLFIRVRHPENYADFRDFKDEILMFTPFGLDKEVYSYQSIVNLDIDRVARQLHAKWAQCKNPLEAWRKTTFFNRESSRASAMGVKNLWRLSGGDENIVSRQESESKKEKVMDADDKMRGVNDKWKSVMATEDMLKYLADAEHRRWMAFHYVRGVRQWNLEKEPKSIEENALKKARNESGDNLKGKQLKANQIDAANSHAALIETEKLHWMDVYLDVKSFELLGANYTTGCHSRRLFELYAKELKAQWKKANMKSHNCPSETDFSSNSRLLALNRCVFVLWDAARGMEKLKEHDNQNDRNLDILKMAQEQLDDFSEKVKNAYASGVLEAKQTELLQGLASAKDKIVKCVSIWRRLFSLRTRRELTEIRIICDNTCKVIEKTDNHFRTLGNMVGNDMEIVNEVPKYLKYFLDYQELNEN